MVNYNDILSCHYIHEIYTRKSHKCHDKSLFYRVHVINLTFGIITEPLPTIKVSKIIGMQGSYLKYFTQYVSRKPQCSIINIPSVKNFAYQTEAKTTNNQHESTFSPQTPLRTKFNELCIVLYILNHTLFDVPGLYISN